MRPEVHGALAGVDFILHAGDVYDLKVIDPEYYDLLARYYRQDLSVANRSVPAP